MEITHIIKYIANKGIWGEGVTYEPITLGASGANLFIVNDGTDKYVLKVSQESDGCDKERVLSYRKEFDFYKISQKMELPFVPEISYAEENPEYGIILIMRYYRPIGHEEWNVDLQKEAVDICARLNSIPVEKIEIPGLKWNPVQIDKEFTHNSYQAWVEVLEEHEGKFDRNVLDNIYENIEKICPILNSDPQYICHGDFHPENILTDGKHLYICDWQGVSIGKSVGDISFFLSRGMGFGIPMDEELLLSYYCERLSEYKGIKMEPETLKKERSASNLLTTFFFWAYYLKNASYESVFGHFQAMEDAARVLNIL